MRPLIFAIVLLIQIAAPSFAQFSFEDDEKADNFNPSKSVVVISSIDPKGNVTKKPIFTSKDVEVITVPKVCEQISNTEVVLFGKRKKTQQFGLLKFN